MKNKIEKSSRGSPWRVDWSPVVFADADGLWMRRWRDLRGLRGATGRGTYRGVQGDATELMKSLARLRGLSSVLDRSPDFVEADGTPLRAGVVDLAQGKQEENF